MKKVYISLPVTGNNYNDQSNHAFNVAASLGMKGFDPVSQFDVVKRPEAPDNEVMGKCVEALLLCDAICLCKGWQESQACKAELGVALAFGLDVMSE